MGKGSGTSRSGSAQALAAGTQAFGWEGFFGGCGCILEPGFVPDSGMWVVGKRFSRKKLGTAVWGDYSEGVRWRHAVGRPV